MVIGNGLIAKAFDSYRDREDVIIFASGVSNSSISQDRISFDREINLIKDILKYQKKIIYFSTCSIVDGSVKTPYINHKIEMENIISSNSSNFLIFRLPIVFGLSNNINTFFNSISNKIINNETIITQRNISRYIIDIDDLSFFLPLFIDSSECNMTINVCFDNRELVEKMILMMEKYLGIISSKIYIDMMPNSPIDNTYFLQKIKSIGQCHHPDYTEKIIEKYCKLKKIN